MPLSSLLYLVLTKLLRLLFAYFLLLLVQVCLLWYVVNLTNILCFYRLNCKNPHTLDSPHNMQLLVTHGLNDLTEKQVFQLLLQNDPYLLPEVGFTESRMSL